MNKKIIVLSLFCALFISKVSADEGMWLLNLIDKQLYELMKSKGLELKQGQIYNPEQIALSDAIVAIDGGMCSGSIISDKGLMITNHHCAYGDVHALSTSEHNYLEDGFWAMSMDQEKPIKGKSVTFLRGIVDVTDHVGRVIDSLEAAGPRGMFFMNKVSGIVEEKYKDSPYEKALSSEWKGTKYYLYFYETFSDVRLVGAPPASIGAFGGETDNWGWPQHKGDFAMYRVYTAPDGSPATYSEENKPMKPKRFLTVSSKGVKEDDFIMILGYPGRTNRYVSSFQLQEQFDILNPIANSVRRAKLDVWKKYMDSSDEIRLKYSDKYFGISNYTDYAKWNNLCIDRFDIINKIKAKEVKLEKWISQKPERVEEYGNVLKDLEKGYRITAEVEKYKNYFQESLVRGSEFVGLGQRYKGVSYSYIRKKLDTVRMDNPKVKEFLRIADNLFASADVEVDRDLFKVMIKYYLNEVPKSYYSEPFVNLLARFDGDSDAMIDYVYDNSNITNIDRLKEFFSQDRPLKEYMSDPMIDILSTISIRDYNRQISSALKTAKIAIGRARSKYTQAMYQMQKEAGLSLYPDANSTMRLTFGEVGGIKPRDAVRYDFLTTTQGILEKQDPNNYEFHVKPRLEKLLKEKDWGRWGKDGVLYVNFMSDNDITGGNSGSGVLNAKGELVGLAFDGNRESMAGDVFFVEGYCKCVSVDIRYVLWIIDKYAGAKHLIEELVIN